MKVNRVQDIYPLSPLQQGMLFHSLSDAIPGIYCEQVVGQIQGRFDVARFRAALGRLVERHETLRTAFVWQDVDEPLQVVQDSAVLQITEHEWTGLDGARDARLQMLLDAERQRGFNLGEAPLFRADVARVDTGHVFVLTFHHAILDGWSLSVLLRELISIYERLRAGAPVDLGPRRPFRDYVAWLLSRDAHTAEDFWRTQLRGFTAPTALIDRLAARDSRSRTVQPAEEIVWLSEGATAAVRATARRCGITLNTFVQGAWALLLSRITSEDEVVFGALVSGRPPELAGIESMTGVFINTVPVRAKIERGTRVDEFLRDLQALNGRLREHEHVSLARIQSVSELTRGQPLFESVLVFENYPAEIESVIRDATGGTWEVQVRSLQLTNYPVHLMVVPGPRLLLDLTFDATAIVRPIAAQLMATLRALIETMAARPEATLGALSLAGHTNGPVESMGTERARPAASFRELFEIQSARHADRPAARDAHRTWTYGELRARASAGAARLAALGAGPEVVVALLGSRDLDFLAAMLSILGAEAAFLPVDPRQPLARQLDMLERSRARILVASAQHAAPLLKALPRPGPDAPVAVELSVLTGLEGVDGSWRPPTPSGPGQLAYIIYTSGSSGAPKGAMLEQRGLVNHLLAKVEELPLGPDDVVAQTAPAGFDISIWQSLAPLLAGGVVHIFPDDVALDGTRLPAEAGRAGVTVLETVPTLLRAMLDDLENRGASAPRLDRLRLLLSTGEALPAEVCRAWLARFPGVPVVNAYGPTECSDDVTHHVIETPPQDGGIVPIGRPLPNTRLYVVDDLGHPLPPGFVGELYVGGDGVGRGYVGDPERTAAVFLEDGFSERPPARLYRTGDRVRQRSDGVFEYLGRRDGQVKIHGYRIELEEIEARLAEHAAGGAAAVVAAPSIGGNRLVAFVTLRKPVDDGDLRAFLHRVVPDYMVPSVFVRQDQLPLTPNGKIDRKSLAHEAPQEPTAAVALERPRDEIEAALARIWCGVLQRDEVGINQNFFELGGDSILIMQVVSRARQADLAITVRQMFEHQTIEAVACAVRGEIQTVAAKDAPVGPIALTPMQAWFFELPVPCRHHWNMSLRLETRDRLDESVLRRAVEALVAHHDALRLRFAKRGVEWSAEVVDRDTHELVSVIEVASLTAAAKNETMRRHEAELQRSLDLESGPLLRIAFFDNGPSGPSELLLIAHHLVVDAVSLRILVEDLETTYLALRDDRNPALPSKTASFQAWTQRLQAWADSDLLRAEWDFWLGTHAGRRARLTPHQSPASNTEGDARVHEVLLNAAETQALTHLLPSRGIAAHDALLAALGEALARHSSEGAIVVDVEGHGRQGSQALQSLTDGIDVTRTVGWFTTLSSLSLGPSARLGVFQRYARVHASRRSLPNDGIGYGLLRHFGGDASLVEAIRALPSPEVSFNYFGQVDAAFAGSRLFAAGREGRGPDRDPKATRPHLLDVSCGIFGGRLRVLFLHDAGLSPATISFLAQDFVEALRALLASPEHIVLEAAAAGGADEPALVRTSQSGASPLSFAQHGLWFLEQLHPGTPVSNSSAGFHLEGPLDIEVLQRALNEIARRHETLRTIFAMENGSPVARASDASTIELQREKLPLGPSEGLHQAVARRAALEGRRPFDLTCDPPLRVTLLSVAPEDHVLLIGAHHIAFDGWSFGVFGREWLALYKAFRAGRPSPLPALPVQYSDFARWQKNRLRGPHLARLLDYWRRRLDAAPTVHDLPTDRSRPLTLGFRGARRHHALSPALSDSLRLFARRRGTTLFVVLLTAFNLALARRSRSKDILVGGTVAGRTRPELESLIGVFVNTVVLRTNLTGAQSFATALERTTATVVEALQYEELPFELLVQELRLEVRTSHAPIVQLGFAMQNMPMPRLEISGLRVVPLEIDHGAARADLVLFATDAHDGIRLSVEHNTDLFDPHTVDALLVEIEELLVEGVNAGSDSLADGDMAQLADAQVDALLRQLVERS